MDAFTIRDLRERTGELIRDAEAGKLSIVTKHGQPVFVAVPFDETLLKAGWGWRWQLNSLMMTWLVWARPQSLPGCL